MKLTVLGFLICQICMYFVTIGEGNLYTISAYVFWLGIFLVILGLFSNTDNK